VHSATTIAPTQSTRSPSLGTLYFGSVQTMPFARPHFADILAAIDYVLKNNYPARGEVRDL
jgi:hypothetical protein